MPSDFGDRLVHRSHEDINLSFATIMRRPPFVENGSPVCDKKHIDNNTAGKTLSIGVIFKITLDKRENIVRMRVDKPLTGSE